MAESPRPQLTLGEFNDLIKNIETFWGIGARLSIATSGQDCTFLIREASLAFNKTMMSLMGFLRFIPSSQYFTDQKVRIIDLSYCPELTNVDALKELKALQTLDLTGSTRLSPEPVNQLREALPQTAISF